MTAREARNHRREEERKQAKLARKAERNSSANQIQTGFLSQKPAEPSNCDKINRQNAQHSTGPKSPEGKLASSRNSLKHGLASGALIIPGEDASAFEALLHDLLEDHQPASPTEALLVRELAQSYWLSQRALRLQNECFTENGIDEKRLSLFLRYQTTHERSFHKALNTLLKLKKERMRGFVSQTRTQVGKHPGFASQNDPENTAIQSLNPNYVFQNSPEFLAEAA